MVDPNVKASEEVEEPVEEQTTETHDESEGED